MGLGDVLDHVQRHRVGGRVRNRLKDRIRLEGLATLLLLVLITALFTFQWVERRHRVSENQRQICAIRAYIEGQYAITASPGSNTPPEILKARRAVIQMFEDRMDGNCK